ncbi:hypothetical protein [Streptomyces flavidovirens]|uniref:hypothetical protein n=1 Tax=Streptomyces flavidovirens TaxID=67298 RepID=UPI0004238883|nr:hypothetical protein [Streptomyces flavidovirens]
MPWVRLDDRFPSHRKVALLSDRAFRLYVSALCWSSENLTEGKILDRELTLVARVRNTKSAATELEAAKLWDRVDDGWMIHDFLEYNPDRAKVKADREANAARQQAYRERKKAEQEAKRNAEKIKRNGVTDPSRNASRNGGSNDTPSPPPSPTPSSPTEKKQASTPVTPDADIPQDARPLVHGLTTAGVSVRWPFKGNEWFPLLALIAKTGVPAMVDHAVKVARRTEVESAKYFLNGWAELPPLPPAGTDRPPLRAVANQGWQPYQNPVDPSVYQNGF